MGTHEKDAERLLESAYVTTTSLTPIARQHGVLSIVTALSSITHAVLAVNDTLKERLPQR